jgi:II/X family phage/plasmid replication protein
MIDMLILRCCFADEDNLTIKDLPIPKEASICPEDGEVFNHRHQWETIPSSHDSLAFKVFDYDLKDGRNFYIEIKASPAKIMQGHNVFGTDDIGKCCFALIECLGNKYPDLLALLNMDSWTVEGIDVTYHSFADSQTNCVKFINSLANISNGQTKASSAFGSTTYFGKKNSRIKKIKVYSKKEELLFRRDQIKKKGDPRGILQYYTEDLINYTNAMIRWEVSFKARWFERRKISNNMMKFIKEFDPKSSWVEAMSPIFKALEGKQGKLK